MNWVISIFVLVCFICTMRAGIFLSDFGRDYFDDLVEKRANEKIAELQTKGKPAYCSFY